MKGTGNNTSKKHRSISCLDNFIYLMLNDTYMEEYYVSRHVYEPQCQKPYLRTCVPCEDSDQPAHSCNLITFFTERILDSQRCKVSLQGQRRLWPDCADAHANLSLRWAHMSVGKFSHIVTL